MSDQPPESLVSRLGAAGQSHLLRFWDELSAAGRQRLVDQLQGIDLEQIARLVAGEDDKPDFAALAARATPPPSVRADGTGAAWSPAEARRAGQQALAAGRLAVVVAAGGQGTRLGFDQPKGLFQVGPLSQRTLFQFLADRLLAVQQRCGAEIPLYLVTSPATHEPTRQYWADNQHLGLKPENLRICCQGTMPAVDATSGKLLLADKDSLSLSPDGHGGVVQALQRGGCFDDAARRGIDLLFYVQVDNPLVLLLDADTIGHHLNSGSEMTTQVIRKRYPDEKVGNVVTVDGELRIIEYSDLPAEAAERRSADGELQLWAGNIAVHVMDVPFLCRVAQSVDALPFHRASKATPYVDRQGQRVQPSSPNSIKFERFIFDLLPSAENAFVVEVAADEAFAPVKNADGAAHDTPQQAKQAIIQLHRRWAQQAGAELRGDVAVELNPRFALDADELATKLPAGTVIDEDRYFASPASP